MKLMVNVNMNVKIEESLQAETVVFTPRFIANPCDPTELDTLGSEASQASED